ncbi:MAG TPA: hypothetical protein VLR94_03550, partial [Acidobacteriota bacterium]|nr:hypothetical protein [Acidobacteriota bacterium]
MHEDVTVRPSGVQRLMNPAALHAVKVAGFFILLYSLFFAPVLLSKRIMAPGDALALYLPSFLSPFSLWEPNLQGGIPVAADLQTASLYPVARLFALAGSWNAFVISGYVLLSCFTYAFVYFRTRSWVGALVSGIAAGMSGFMMAHLAHTIVTHGMAWIPLILLALEKLRADAAIKWLAAGAAAVALSLLSGHPQVPAYGMLVAAGYALMLLLIQPTGRIRFALLAIAMVLAGIGLAAVQLVPLFELISQSIRVKPTFTFFVYYSLPPAHMVGLLFPALFGTYEQSFYPYPYFGPANPIEFSGYMGVITILLIFIGIQHHKERHLVGFWIAVTIVAGLLALGKATPLAHWLFLVPGLNNLRVPARHLSEMTLAVCFLAGFGASALHKGQATRKTIFTAAGAGFVMFLIAGTVIWFRSGKIAEMAGNHGITNLSLAPWANPAIEIPVALLIAATAVLFLYARKQTPMRTALFIAMVVVDLASFALFCQWRLSPGKEIVQMPESLRKFQEQLKETHQRILPALGVFSLPEEGAPNLTRLWDIPNASGYGSLILKRTSKLLSMPTEGTVNGDWAEPTNTSLDLMAVRYVVWRSDPAARSIPNLPEIPQPPGFFPLAQPRRWRLVR